MKLLGENIHAVNIGADIFADALKAQEIETQQLNWTPPSSVPSVHCRCR